MRVSYVSRIGSRSHRCDDRVESHASQNGKDHLDRSKRSRPESMGLTSDVSSDRVHRSTSDGVGSELTDIARLELNQNRPQKITKAVFLTKQQREELKRQRKIAAEELKLVQPTRLHEEDDGLLSQRSSFHSRSTEQKEYPRENRKRSEDSYRRYPAEVGEDERPSTSQSAREKNVDAKRVRSRAKRVTIEEPAASRRPPNGGKPVSSSQSPSTEDAMQDDEATGERVVARAWDTQTESSLSELSLLQLSETDVSESVNKKSLNQIREHYLGLRKEKRKIQKPSEKFRNIFNFEWSAAEDTTRGDSNTLYQSRIEPQLLFGRGFRAGVDVREQRRHNNFYDELVKRRAALEGPAKADMAAVYTAEAREALMRSRDIEAKDPNRKHWTDKSREEMVDRDWRIFREDYEIYIKGGRVPPPIRKWSEANLPSELLDAIKRCGYEKPTPIQMQAIPISLEQRDLIGIAETGSGKTAAFVLPMLTYVKSLPPLTDETSQDGPYALVLAPSRELAIQIDEETRKFASFCTCRAVAVVGGRSAEAQAFELRRGAEIVIGTPGRIKDCLERSYTVLSQCNYVVLDEADRMIDMGFEEIVNWILDQIPSSNLKSEDEDQVFQQELEAKAGYRQYRLTHMFSATMPPAVERLARKYLRSPAYISIGDPGAGKRAIEQRLEFLTEPRKRQRLQEILESAEPPIMVFVNQKKAADVLAKTLAKMNFNVASLHGGKAQETREQSLHDFKTGVVDILVATDVAGRGIDIEGVKLVVNFDLPKDIGSYTHRIGRTGRAGRKGLAISFCTEEDSHLFCDLRQFLQSSNNVVPLELSNHPMSKVKPGTVGTSASTMALSSGAERSDRRPPLC